MTATDAVRRPEVVVEALRAAVAPMLAERTQHLRTDVDPEAWIEAPPAFLGALADLVRAAGQTAPPESELFLSVVRPGTRLTRVGDAELVLRWQVEAPARRARDGVVVPLRPVSPGAAGVAESPAIAALSTRLTVIGWHLDVAILGDEDSGGRGELRAHLRRKDP